MTQNHTIDWIETIDEALKELNSIPLMGNSPEFPWKELSDHMISRWSLAGCSLIMRDSRWRNKEELQQDLGSNLHLIAVEFSLIRSCFFILISQSDLHKLIVQLLKVSDKEAFDQGFEEGLLNYFIADLTQKFTRCEGFSDLSANIIEQPTLSLEDAFCCDIELKTGENAVFARTLMPKTFLKSWKDHFSHNPRIQPSQEQLKKISVNLNVEIAKTVVNLQEWQNVQNGDFLVLDSCSYNPEDRKGSATLYINDRQLFKARLKENTLKIQDYPLDFEELTFMDNDEYKEEDEEDMEDLYEDEDSEDEDLDDHLDNDEDDAHQDIENKESAIGSIPVTISVQIAQIKMNAEQLMALKPGNTLELEENTSSTVKLVANGKKIGKGQLIRMGETLGVRITEI